MKKSNNNKNDKNDKLRLRELQKKYENIYEKKKNYNISFDDRYKKYLDKNEINLYEPKKAYDNNKLRDSSNKNDFNNERTKFKRKILINQLNKNRIKTHKTNLSQEFNQSSNYKKQFIYNTYSNSPKNTIIINPNSEGSHNKSRIIIKKLKIAPKFGGNFERKNSNSIGKHYENKISREIFKVYNVKNIVTSDKRLYVHINYISLYNDKKNYHKSKNNYYKYNLLKISDKIIINFNHNRLIDILKSNKKHEKLANIIEENSVKNYNSSNENDSEGNVDISNENENSEENTHILQNDVVKNIVLDFNKDNESITNIDDNINNNNNIEFNKLKIYDKENERYF
jgi:hypothetical protein